MYILHYHIVNVSVVTSGINSVISLWVFSFTVYHSDGGGLGWSGCATSFPDPANHFYFLCKYKPSASTTEVPSSSAWFTLEHTCTQ